MNAGVNRTVDEYTEHCRSRDEDPHCGSAQKEDQHGTERCDPAPDGAARGNVERRELAWETRAGKNEEPCAQNKRGDVNNGVVPTQLLEQNPEDCVGAAKGECQRNREISRLIAAAPGNQEYHCSQKQRSAYQYKVADPRWRRRPRVGRVPYQHQSRRCREHVYRADNNRQPTRELMET